MSRRWLQQTHQSSFYEDVLELHQRRFVYQEKRKQKTGLYLKLHKEGHREWVVVVIITRGNLNNHAEDPL